MAHVSRRAEYEAEFRVAPERDLDDTGAESGPGAWAKNATPVTDARAIASWAGRSHRLTAHRCGRSAKHLKSMDGALQISS
ncbi:hypothetical protein AB0L66_35780 [Streptomyces sp. NPDC052207]|uniref:hypothetical protein n=1 Tax=Streptomyces sp. NPDC052207 TaxID=3155418 RepID=UPI00342BB7D3